MTIQALYTQYQIMPNLQLHMYRVTAVAEQICENLSLPINSQEVLAACLLHDIGNIIKFDLEKLPTFLQPEGVEFWKGVQREYVAKYGADEHDASLQIAREVKVSPRVLELVDAVSFTHIQKVVESDDYAKKICEYADDRVTPHGVTSLEERLDDLEARYHDKFPSPEHQAKRKQYGALARQLEEQIFAHAKIRPEEITDHSINTRLENLRKFEIIE